MNQTVATEVYMSASNTPHYFVHFNTIRTDTLSSSHLNPLIKDHYSPLNSPEVGVRQDYEKNESLIHFPVKAVYN